jgi:hypothetical protein
MILSINEDDENTNKTSNVYNEVLYHNLYGMNIYPNLLLN